MFVGFMHVNRLVKSFSLNGVKYSIFPLPMYLIQSFMELRQLRNTNLHPSVVSTMGSSFIWTYVMKIRIRRKGTWGILQHANYISLSKYLNVTNNQKDISLG